MSEIDRPFGQHGLDQGQVRRNMHQLMEKSSRIRGLVEDGSLLLVGAVYNVKTGAVTFQSFLGTRGYGLPSYFSY